MECWKCKKEEKEHKVVLSNRQLPSSKKRVYKCTNCGKLWWSDG